MPIDPQDAETYREMLQIALAQLHEALQKCVALGGSAELAHALACFSTRCAASPLRQTPPSL